MPKIRTTMRPDVEVEVGDAEYLDLQRQGLVVEDEPTAKPAAATTKAAAPATTKEG